MRRVLTVLAAVTVIAVGALVFVVLPDDGDSDGSAANKLNALTASQSSTGTWTLELDGFEVPRVTVVSSGEAAAKIVAVDVGTEFQPKSVQSVGHDEIVVDVSAAPGSGIFKHITEQWSAGLPRFISSGSLTHFDPNGQHSFTRNFSDALIAGVQLPKLDVAVSAPATFRVRLAPTTTSDGPAPSSQKSTAAFIGMATNTFRVNMGGAPRNVQKVDAFEVTTAVFDAVALDSREAARLPGSTTFPDLRITVTETESTYWRAWATDFLIKGNNDQAAERSGSIEYLTANLQTAAITVGLNSCGPIRVAPVIPVPADGVRRVTVDLYCEQMSFAGR